MENRRSGPLMAIDPVEGGDPLLDDVYYLVPLPPSPLV